MKKLILVLLCVVMSITNALPWQSSNTDPLINQNSILPPFNSVLVIGNVDVNVFAGQSVSTLNVSGPQFSQKCLNARVVNNVLQLRALSTHVTHGCEGLSANVNMGQLNEVIIRGNSNFAATHVTSPNLDVTVMGGANVNISGNNIGLNSLVVHGLGNVTIGTVDSSALAVDIAGNGNINLQGKVNLQSLRYVGNGSLNLTNVATTPMTEMCIGGSGDVNIQGVMSLQKLVYNGTGHLRLYWIDSPTFDITSLNERNAGLIEIAGVTDVLHVDIRGCTHLDARFLRAQIGFIHTENKASADVWVRKNLFTLATDSSNIYYFIKPVFLTTDNRTSGTVLGMYNIPGSLLELHPGWFN